MKKWLAVFLAVCLPLVLCRCAEDGFTPELSDVEPAGDRNVQTTDEWAIYWYLCGSDLETNNGCATMDLVEMMEVELPENVKVVIQTGGSAEWQNDTMDASALERYVYDSEGLTFIEAQPSASMGEAETLADFLTFASENYPAEKTAVLFWNHGGGSVSGAAFDELYGLDSLTLDEMYDAFSSVFSVSADEPPIDLIGFDTCLMATVDVAATFYGIGNYLVASEEVEPGNGWYYTGFLGALAEDPTMDAATLGAAVCDSFYAGCEAVGTADSVTLSLVDLTEITDLLEAYEVFGAEALTAAVEDPSFFAHFGRAAVASENYGGNTREQGYTNMVDLGHLARQASEILPDSAEAVLEALDNCVLYKVNGPYRAESTGLSCYYSYSADLDDFTGYANVGAGEAFKHYFAYGLTGELSEEGIAYIGDVSASEVAEVPTIASQGWADLVPAVNEDGNAVLTLGESAVDVLASIGFQLYYADPENDLMFLLGTDNDIIADWESGVFCDNFRGCWGALDGCLVYMELCFAGDDYNVYSVPVLLNGEEYNLSVVYDFTDEAWYIEGARQALDASGMADKNLRLLVEGDEITTIHYVTSISGEEAELTSVEIDTLTVTEDTSFAEVELGDGMYVLLFEMQDVVGDIAYSDAVVFETVEGEIFTYTVE